MVAPLQKHCCLTAVLMTKVTAAAVWQDEYACSLGASLSHCVCGGVSGCLQQVLDELQPGPDEIVLPKTSSSVFIRWAGLRVRRAVKAVSGARKGLTLNRL